MLMLYYGNASANDNANANANANVNVNGTAFCKLKPEAQKFSSQAMSSLAVDVQIQFSMAKSSFRCHNIHAP